MCTRSARVKMAQDNTRKVVIKIKLANLPNGETVVIDDTLQEMVDAVEDGLVTVELIKKLISQTFGCSYEEIAKAVKEAE